MPARVMKQPWRASLWLCLLLGTCSTAQLAAPACRVLPPKRASNWDREWARLALFHVIWFSEIDSLCVFLVEPVRRCARMHMNMLAQIHFTRHWSDSTRLSINSQSRRHTPKKGFQNDSLLTQTITKHQGGHQTPPYLHFPSSHHIALQNHQITTRPPSNWYSELS